MVLDCGGVGRGEALTYLVVRYAQLLAKFKVDEQKVSISNPLAYKLRSPVHHVCWDVGAMEAVKEFCFT